jgi:hypothetical protein
MDLGLVAGVAMIIVWAIGALVLDAPGWIHLLLTLGVALIIYRVVVRDPTGRPPAESPNQTPHA